MRKNRDSFKHGLSFHHSCAILFIQGSYAEFQPGLSRCFQRLQEAFDEYGAVRPFVGAVELVPEVPLPSARGLVGEYAGLVGENCGDVGLRKSGAYKVNNGSSLRS